MNRGSAPSPPELSRARRPLSPAGPPTAPSGPRLLAAVVLAAVVALAVGAVVGRSACAAWPPAAAAVYEEGAVPLQVLGELNLAQDDTRRELLNVLVSQSPADIEDNRGDVGTADARLP